MLINVKGKYPYIKIFENEHSLLITDLNGKNITVLGIKGNHKLNYELERINRLQGIRMKYTGQGVPY